MVRYVNAVLATAAAFGLAACTNLPPRLDAERQWGRAIADLGMFPIYPPSEDVMIGDAFLHLPDAQYFDLVRIATAPGELLARALCGQEGDRLIGDATKDGASGTVPMRGRERRDRLNDCGDRRRIAAAGRTADTNHVARLREAQVPTLDVGRFSEGEIAGAGLFGNLAATLGLGWSAASGVRVELGELQSLSLDEVRGSELLEYVAISRWRRMRDRGEDYPYSLTPIMLARSLMHGDNRNGTGWTPYFCAGQFSDLDRRGIRVVVANRLLYANKITFDFLLESVTGIRAAADLSAMLSGLPRPTAAPAAPGGRSVGPLTRATVRCSTAAGQSSWAQLTGS